MWRLMEAMGDLLDRNAWGWNTLSDRLDYKQFMGFVGKTDIAIREMAKGHFTLQISR